MHDRSTPKINAIEDHEGHDENIVTNDEHSEDSQIPISESAQPIAEGIDRKEEHHQKI